MATRQSRSPSCVWVSPQEIGGRVDASYFHHEYLSLDSSLAHISERDVIILDRLLMNPRRVLYQKTTSYSEEEAPEGAVPFIAGVDLDGSTMTINWSSVRYVGRWMLESYPKGKLTDGSLLIKVKGPNQHTAFVSKATRTALVSGTVFCSQVQGCNPFYLAAYLSSRQGTAWRSRLRTNTTVEFIGNKELRAVPVPVPDHRVQDYIGAKVELAERYCNQSAALCAEACSRFNERLRTDGFHAGRALTNVIAARTLTDRLTSEFYLPRYFALDAHLTSLGVPVKPMRSLLRNDIIRSSTPERTEDAPVPCILTSDIDPYELRWRSPSLRVTRAVHDTHSGRLEALDVVYTSVGPPVGEAAVVLPQFLPMAVGGDVSILRHGDNLHPGFLALYLNSVFGQMQNDRYSRGIRQRRVYPEDVGSFLVPVLSTRDQTYIGERIIRHHLLNEAAVDLVNEAKADVDALLEGTLDVDAILTGSVKAPTADDIPELTEAYT